LNFGYTAQSFERLLMTVSWSNIKAWLMPCSFIIKKNIEQYILQAHYPLRVNYGK
jgi:hypothetical protein